MSSRTLMVWVLVSVILFSTFCVVRSCRSSPERMGTGIAVDEAIAYRLGRVIAERLPGSDPVLVVQEPTRSPVATAAAKRRLAALARGLGDTDSKVIVASPENLPDPERFELMERLYDGQWNRHLTAWLAKQPKPRAVVSFMGIPKDLPEEAFPPPLLALHTSPGKSSVEELLQRKAVFAVAVPRPDADFKSIPPADAKLEEIFDARYILRMREMP